MRILVTGGAGFIGSNFVHYSLKHHPEHTYTVVDALTYAGNEENLPDDPRVKFIRGDISDRNIKTTIRGHDLVINFAAESHNDNSILAPFEFIRTNIEGTMNLALACADLGIRLHHISTDEVYGDMPLSSHDLFTLDSPYNPSSPYSASKAASDHFIRAAIRTYGLSATISNCTNNYGPRQHAEKFIPRQIIRLIKNQPMRIYGDGLNIRDWIHVDDHNSAIWTILERGMIGKTYLISARCEKNNRQIAQLLTQFFPGAQIEFISDRAGHDRRYALDPSSIEELGWRPLKDLEEGLAETIQWYKENRWLWDYAAQEAEEKYSKTERPMSE